jgi:alkanesulfonate monooxygenase SsuD/methylene tetrahydromethanopterin reductase-like flavin-dependent oxidoreductase (luciferase family)
VLIAARAAPVTHHIGLVPTVIATHTEPFHISKAIATLDYVSTGRAGVRIRASLSQHEAAHSGRSCDRRRSRGPGPGGGVCVPGGGRGLRLW